MKNNLNLHLIISQAECYLTFEKKNNLQHPISRFTAHSPSDHQHDHHHDHNFRIIHKVIIKIF